MGGGGGLVAENSKDFSAINRREQTGRNKEKKYVLG